MVEIDCSAEKDTEIYVTYSLLCGDNVTFSAVTASDGNTTDIDPDAPEPEPQKDVITFVDNYTEKFDLTANGTKDWEYYGALDGQTAQEQRKAGSTDIITTVFNTSGTHWDNDAEVTWSDGKDVQSMTTRHGINTSKGVSVTVKTAGCTEIKVLVGAWKAKNVVSVYDAQNLPMESHTLVSAGDDAYMTLVTVDLSDYKGDTITLNFEASESSGGNISLTAVTVK